MKLCITSVGKEIGAKVNTAFGRAPYFLLINTDTNAVETLENMAANQGQGAGIKKKGPESRQGAFLGVRADRCSALK